MTVVTATTPATTRAAFSLTGFGNANSPCTRSTIAGRESWSWLTPDTAGVSVVSVDHARKRRARRLPATIRPPPCTRTLGPRARGIRPPRPTPPPPTAHTLPDGGHAAAGTGPA